MEERPNCKICGKKLTKKNNGKSVTCSRECSNIYSNQQAKIKRQEAKEKTAQAMAIFKTFEQKPEYDDIFLLRDIFTKREDEVLFKQNVLNAFKYKFRIKKIFLENSLKNRKYAVSIATINELIQLFDMYKECYVKSPTIMRRDLLFKVQKIIGNAIKLQEQKDINGI